MILSSNCSVSTRLVSTKPIMHTQRNVLVFMLIRPKKKEYLPNQKVVLSGPVFSHLIMSVEIRHCYLSNWAFFTPAKGSFKYYVIKEVGGWGQKMEILDDLYSTVNHQRVGWVGLKKSKT